MGHGMQSLYAPKTFSTYLDQFWTVFTASQTLYIQANAILAKPVAIEALVTLFTT
jgi:hypothetical protein